MVGRARCGCFVVIDRRRKYIPLTGVEAHTTIVANTSRTTLTQTFENPESAHPLEELRYVFPLYDGVSVVGFTYAVGSRVIRGIVKERAKAKRVYDDAKQQGLETGLLEQSMDAADVFTTRVGHIPAGETIKVDIEYLGELKHDAEADAIRLTIPTSIAPRYGSSETLAGPSWRCAGGTQPQKGFSVVVDAEMPRGSIIRSIQSPSHPISVQIGFSSKGSFSDQPSLERASASLSLGSADLDQDFIIQVAATKLGEPSAVLELHPTIPNQRTLMATVVPKFDLPEEKPEIVFVCDRSGSMGSGSKIPNLTAALNIFLKSLPVGIKFNICSFGNRYEFLWERAVTYDQNTLDKAVAYVCNFNSNFGGTEMYEPMTQAFKRRYKDMNLEVFLLTDGDVWDQQKLIHLINEEVSASNGGTRVFTLGIGRDVSHSLIEGAARAGNGFAQSVGDNEQMAKKVVRMLKGSLMPHVRDYTLEVNYGSVEDMDNGASELIEKVTDALDLGSTKDDVEIVEAPMESISLFNPDHRDTSDENLEMINAEPAVSKYSHLPQIETPRYLQAPFQIPSLFPFNRTTVYLMLPADCPERIPKSVILKGKSAHGPVHLGIPVTELKDKGETIHQLAARNAVRELEDGRGWIFHAKKRGSDKLLRHGFEGRFSDMVEREAVKLGAKYQIAGKWCSFVAVGETGQQSHLGGGDDDMGVLDAAEGFSMKKKKKKKRSRPAAAANQGGSQALPAHELRPPGPRGFACRVGSRRSNQVSSSSLGLAGPQTAQAVKPACGSGQPSDKAASDGGRCHFGASNHHASQGSNHSSLSDPKANEDPLQTIVSLQAFAGNWTWSAALEGALGLGKTTAEQAGKAAGLPQPEASVLATAFATAYLQKKLPADKDAWEMIIDKANSWLRGYIDQEKYDKLAEAVWEII